MANTGNTQQQINYGSAANDGQGDPLRTAFIKTDDNFDNIWLAGPVGSNITIVNNTIQTNNVNGNIVLRPNGVGVIQANSAIVPNATNLRDLGSSAQRFRAAYIGTGGLSVDGNVTVTGNLTAGNISYTGNVFVGDLQGSVYADDSTIMVDAIDNEMFATAATFGRANVTGNVAANYFIGNGSLLTGVASSYGNAEVADYLASGFGSIGSNTVVTAGNIVARALGVGNITNQFPLGIQTSGGGVWEFAGNILRGPQGGSWQSDTDTAYFNSPANGYLNLSSLFLGNVVSELFMEHSFIRFLVDNGTPQKTWQMNLSGEFSVPGDIIPQSNGTASLGNATNRWSNIYLTGNTIFLGSANISTTESGTVAIPGVSVAQDQPSSIEYTGSAPYNDDGVFPSTPVIVDYLTFYLSNPAATAEARAGFVPAVYAAQMSGGNIIGVDIVSPGIYNGPNAATLNTDNMLALPAGTPLTYSAIWAAAQAAVAPFGPFRAGVLSTTTVVASSPALYVGGVALAVEAGNVLTVNGEAVLSNDSDATITTTGNITANYFIGDGSQLTNLPVSYTNLIENGDSNVTISIPNGNITVSANTETWTFANTGDLTVPGNITTTLSAAIGNIVDNVRTWDSAGANLYVWFDAAATPEIVELNTLSGGNVNGWLVEVDGGNQALITATNPAGFFSISTNQALTGSGTLTFSSPDYEPPTPNPLQIDIGGNVWAFDNTGNLTLPTSGSLIVDGGDGVIGPVSDDMVISWDNEDLRLVSVQGSIEMQADSAFRVQTNYDGGNDLYAGRWEFSNNELVNISDDFGIVSEAGNLTLSGGRDGVNSGNTTISAVDVGVAVYDWTFDNTGNLTVPGNISTSGNILAGNISANTAGFAIGYRDIPQVAFTGNATIAATDAGKHFYSTESTDYILTIADNSAVSWPVGTAITVVNRGTGNITVAQASGVSLYLAGNNTAGNRTVSTYGMATVLNVAANVWMINGTGVA